MFYQETVSYVLNMFQGAFGMGINGKPFSRIFHQHQWRFSCTKNITKDRKVLHQAKMYGLAVIFGAVCLLLPLVLNWLRKRRKGRENKNGSVVSMETRIKPRFRKRDRLRFYTTKMLRKVKQFKEDVLPGPEELDEFNLMGKKRKLKKRSSNLQGLASRFLHFQNPNDTERRLKRPPAALLEADLTQASANDSHLPAEIMYMLKSVRVFGHFEKPLFFELCKHVISKTCPAGKVIFKTGSMDECIYIVQHGQLNLYLVDKKGNEMLLKKVNAGENIHSVMNILDALRGCSGAYKYSVMIRAATESHILLLPSRAFKQVFDDHPESLVRIVQIVMLRLQQVTFQAFNKFLGLSEELVSSSSQQRVSENLKSLSVYSLSKECKVANAPKEIISPGRTELLKARISSIQEDIEVKPKALGETKSSSKKSAPQIIRKSSGKPVDLYGNNSSMEDRQSNSLSDFDAVLGRVGLEEPVLGGSDDEYMHNMDEFPTQFGMFPELATDADVSYGIPNEEEERMLAAVRADLVKLLHLPTPKLLDNLLAIDVVPAGTYLVQEGDKDSSLFFLVQGLLQILQTNSGQKQLLFNCVPGEFMGSLSLLTGDPSFFSIYTREPCHVVIISKVSCYKLIKEHPRVVLPIANSLVQKMSSFVRNIDFALDWILQESGKPLFRQNEEHDSLYIVLNGRLRSVTTQQCGQKELGVEYGRGECVGLVEVLTRTERAESVHAVRDTELAQIPSGLLNTIKLHYPQVVSRFIELLGERLLGKVKNGSREPPNSKLEMIGKNLGTIAVIPASNSIPLHNFTFELGLAINDIGSTLVLTSDVIKRRFGNAVLDSVHEYNLSNWLAHQEDLHRIVVYQADMYMTEWTKRCIRQADAILIVGMGDEDHAVGKLEAQLERMTFVRAQKDLILLYDEETFVRPTQTVDWLNAREWVSAHHHVRCPKKVFKRRPLSEKYAKDPNYETPSKHSDFARLARVLTGTSIGLVLGGGGARGISHIGIIRCLHEAGIPIDSVGGTSMGAFIGAIYAEHGCVVKTTQRAREACRKMASLWRKMLDMTYPYTSLFTGQAFNVEIQSTFGDMKIEDMLLPYFCITTDISDSKMKVHQTGSCWRYIRASMSLSGYLPPMCDPVDGHLLLDGGYVNNLPADVMRSLGVKTIICVDVGSQDEVQLTNFGDSLSGWWMLWKKLNPFASPVRIPDMNGIQSRLAYVSCVGKLEEVKNSKLYNYIRPPVNRFKTLQFGSYDEILECGYLHGKAVIDGYIRNNVLSTSPDQKHQSKQITVDGNSAPLFTDLAELVSRIKPTAVVPRRNLDSDEEDDEYEVDYERGAMSDMDGPAYQSAPEEIGYESEDGGHFRRRRILQRMYSNAT